MSTPRRTGCSLRLVQLTLAALRLVAVLVMLVRLFVLWPVEVCQVTLSIRELEEVIESDRPVRDPADRVRAHVTPVDGPGTACEVEVEVPASPGGDLNWTRPTVLIRLARPTHVRWDARRLPGAAVVPNPGALLGTLRGPLRLPSLLMVAVGRPLSSPHACRHDPRQPLAAATGVTSPRRSAVATASSSSPAVRDAPPVRSQCPGGAFAKPDLPPRSRR